MSGHLAACAALAAAATIAAQDAPTTEFGTIGWQRDYRTAIAAAEKSQKPILLLFQEVPG